MSSTTLRSELPLHYRHPTLPGTLVLTFAHGQRGVIRGHYFWIIQDDQGGIIEKGAVKGMEKLDQVRNDFIYEGWRRHFPPKVQVKNKNETREAIRARETVAPTVEPVDDPERRAVLERLQARVDETADIMFR